MDMDLLLWLFFIPLIASAVAFIVPVVAGRSLKIVAFCVSLIPLLILILNHSNLIGTETVYSWFPALSLQFYLKIDSLSLLFLYLSSLIIPISILAVKSFSLSSPNIFYGFLFLLQGLLTGFFTARDLAFFTFFWEAMLIPLYFIISIWGGSDRQQAAMKFLIYMIAGSCLMIVGILALYFVSGGSFDMDQIMRLSSNMPYASFIFVIFMLAFAVKTPLFPFHAWLPDTYYQASVSGTILLSAILSKAGIYGFLRIGYEIFPDLMQVWSPVLLGLAIAGVFYGGLAAWMQSDFKRLIAYSSFSHVNFVLVGLFLWQQTAQQGAVLQAINHGITIAALFLVAGWLEDRLGSTSIGKARGMAKYFPQLCWITLFFVLSSVALPGMNNFIGEFMILFGLFGKHPWLAAFVGLTVVLSVIYMLRFMQKVYFEATSHYVPKLGDIRVKELLITLPLVALVLWIGLYPNPILNLVTKSVANTTTP